ncbi:hypothetical protein H0H81_001464 [Sphagnurus paluster]|uniref:Uncharacterized protein n=1 Tax=Sphagnurus paluster TaxID=117069 RepID=A0A9P7FU34_9AGAR|nr:hypothetical protein H0H81_001464 [Sphagnurus paluster]
MAPKRKEAADGEENTGREKKKQKMAAARTIVVQSVKTVNAEAGPSTRPAGKGLNGLPSAIDVEKFAEMDPIRKKILGHSIPKLGKNKRIKRTEMFLRRQKDKLWLETHIWHAKRMKMENMWGYRLAVQPTEKAYRPSHRASVLGSIIHDASYYALVELKGTEFILKKILDSCCDPHGPGPGSKRYCTGLRSLDIRFYKPGAYPYELIAPITVIWQPLPLPSVAEPEPSKSTHEKMEVPAVDWPTSKRKRKNNKAKGKETEQEVPPNQETKRAVWLRVHPLAYEDVLSSLHKSASLVLEGAKRENDRKDFEVEIADMRGQVNVFEVMGPKSNQVIRGALSPVQDQRTEFKMFWSRLGNMQTSGELSRGTIIGFKVADPRLKFPPKNTKAQIPTSDHIPATTVFPSIQLAQSEIWDESVRSDLTKPRYRKKDLDDRRSKVTPISSNTFSSHVIPISQLLIPGTRLTVERKDDRVPILLIQRSLEIDSQSTSHCKSETQGIHGWTIIVPAGWSMAFFSSLIFTGTRVGGQRERQTQAFEAGVPYFPRDLPTSTGYDSYASMREKDEKGRWQRKPPAKRPNFDKLGTSSPWRADWETVLGLPPREPTIDMDEDEEGQLEREVDDHLVTTQREPPVPDADPVETGPRIWLLSGSEAPTVVSNISRLFNHNAGLLQEINRLRGKRGHEPLDASIKGDDLMRGALVSVRVKICKRGAPEDLAMIYSICDIEAKRWEKVLRSPNAQLDAYNPETPEEIALYEIVPPTSSIIGYITTGHFSLSQGRGFGIGAISLAKLLLLQEQSQR